MSDLNKQVTELTKDLMKVAIPQIKEISSVDDDDMGLSVLLIKAIGLVGDLANVIDKMDEMQDKSYDEINQLVVLNRAHLDALKRSHEEIKGLKMQVEELKRIKSNSKNAKAE